MKRILLFLFSLAAASVLSLQAGNYKNFKSVAYVTSQEVNRYGTVEGWEAAWKDFSRNLKLDKVYLSTFNNSRHKGRHQILQVQRRRSLGRYHLQYQGNQPPALRVVLLFRSGTQGDNQEGRRNHGTLL